MRNLGVSSPRQLDAHFLQDFGKAQFGFRDGFVLVEDAQQGAGASATGPTGWIGELKGVDVRDIGLFGKGEKDRNEGREKTCVRKDGWIV